MNGEWLVTELSHQEGPQHPSDRHHDILEEILPNISGSGAVLIEYDLFKSLNNASEEMGQSKVKPLPQSPLENLMVSSEPPPTTETVVVLPISSENVTQPLAATPKIKTKPVFTVQDYRKQVGIKVHNQKPQEKIGIKPMSPVPSSTNHVEEPDVPSPKGKGALCAFCGYVSILMNKCQRCKRKLHGQAKLVDVAPDYMTLRSSQSPAAQPTVAAAAPVNKELFYGNSYSRKPRAVRQPRNKIEEPQCVTLSSSEDEAELPATTGTSEEPEAKKTRTEEETSGLTPKVKEMAVQRTYQRKREMPSSPEGTEAPEPEQPDEKALDLLRWKEAGLKGSFFAVTCRSARIGSYKVAPTDRVLFSSEGIMIEVPIMNADGKPSSKETAKLALSKTQILKLDVHYGKSVPAMFIYLTPMTSRVVRESLKMTKDVPGIWFDPLSTDETYKRVTLLPDHLTDEAKYGIKQAFSVMGVYNEITSAETNRILVLSSPPEVRPLGETSANKENGRLEISRVEHVRVENVRVEHVRVENSRVEISRVTRSSSKPKPVPVPVVPMFSWPDGADRFSVTTEDYACLNHDRLLNDSIIDFYLRYVFSTKTEPEQRSRCHMFSSFFYQRLTTRPSVKMVGRKHPIEDDPKISAAEKRHSRVKSWTKKVDIFDKDFLFVPINEHSHWFLAIICFPGLNGPVSAVDGRPVQLPQRPPSAKAEPKTKKVQRIPLNKLVTSSGQSYIIGSTTITPVAHLPKGKVNVVPVALTTDDSNNDKDEAESDDDLTSDEPSTESVESAPTNEEPVKQPCILIFDSLAGSSRSRVVNTLRDYLNIEYQVKRPVESATKAYDKAAVKGYCLTVPQQNNYSDCGVYVLQYAESFMEKPFSDYRIPMPSLKNWFPAESAARKRKEIQELLLQLTRQLRPEEEAESLIKMLKPSDPPRTEVPSVVVDPTPLAGPNRVVETLVVSMETDVALVTGPESPPAAAEADTEPEGSKTTEEDSTSVD